MLRAVTLDFWDTLYESAVLPERVTHRQTALRRLLDAVGAKATDEEIRTVYAASGAEAERWWREEHRGYTSAERIRWMLERFSVQRPDDCEHVARACQEVDDALLEHPAPLLRGAQGAVEALAGRFALAIVSDTGFASGAAQDCLLERDGIRRFFAATVYSVDVGHAKPRPEPFRAALDALGVDRPDEVLHVGDIERTDVRGALGAGMRAVRLDVVRNSGPSAAEFVASSFPALVEYLLGEA
jgi:putative hydrolase of the HAD superfamily